MRQQTLALAFHTLQAHEKSGGEKGKRKTDSKRGNGKNAATLKLPALQRQILKRCVEFSHARVQAFGHIRTHFLFYPFFSNTHIEIRLHVTAMNPFLLYKPVNRLKRTA